MIRESFFRIFIITALLTVGGLYASAQSAPVAGLVEMEKADGTTVPVAGALVEVFRTDVKGSAPSAKTNKKGEFRFAGFPFNSEYVLSISAAGVRPGFIPNVKAGQTDLKITLKEGDGNRPTEAEVRQALTGSGPAVPKAAEMSKEEKEAVAAREKEIAEIEARNKKIQNESATITAALQAGNKAFGEKNFDFAIEQYNIGIAANPDYFGSAPILLNNKGVALKIRAVNTYNKAAKMTESPEKKDSIAKARSDLEEARSGYSRSWDLLKNAPAAEITDKVNHDKAIYDALLGLTDTYRLLVVTKSTVGVPDEAKTAFEAYQAVEKDTPKKTAAYVTLGDVLLESGESEQALASYQRALELIPENPDALAGVGFSLVNIGYAESEQGKAQEAKAKFQEAVDYLQQFVGVAPENHKYKSDVVALIDTLKNEQKVTPQKKAPVRRKN